MERYERRFAVQEVDMVALRMLGEDDWAQLGLPNGARRKIGDAAREAALLDVDARGGSGTREAERAVGGGGAAGDSVVLTQQFPSSGLGLAMTTGRRPLLRRVARRIIDTEGEEEEEGEGEGEGTVDDADEGGHQSGVADCAGAGGTCAHAAAAPGQADLSRGYTQLESLLDEFDGGAARAHTRDDGAIDAELASLEQGPASVAPEAPAKSPVVYSLDVDSETPTAVRSAPESPGPGGLRTPARTASAREPAPVEVIEISPDAPSRGPRTPPPPPPPPLSPPISPVFEQPRDADCVASDGGASDDGNVLDLTHLGPQSPGAAFCSPAPSPGAIVDPGAAVPSLAHRRDPGDAEAAKVGTSPAGGAGDAGGALGEDECLEYARRSGQSPPRAASVPAGTGITCPHARVADVEAWYDERRTVEILRHRALLASIEAERERAICAAVGACCALQASPPHVSAPPSSGVLGKRHGAEGGDEDEEDGGDDLLDLTQNECESEGDDGGGGSAKENESGGDGAERSRPDKGKSKGAAPKRKRNDAVPSRPPIAEDKDMLDAIRRDAELYDRLLVLEPVSLDAVRNVVRQAGYRVSVANLTTFLDRQGVSYTAPPKPTGDDARQYLKQLNSQR
jgi:Slx4 endonuclease